MTPATADLIDDFGDRCQNCSAQFRSFGGPRSFSGRVRTAKCYDDNVVVKRALSEASPAEVLVVDGAGFLGSALLGDQMAALALSNGWAGVIVYGAVRDAAVLATLPLGVRALGTNPRKSGKDNIGWLDVPVAFGGATFRPGDWLYADDDGVIVSATPLCGEA